MIEYLTIDRSIIFYMKHLTDDALRVYLCLLDRRKSQSKRKLGMTMIELARIADVTEGRAQRAIDHLEECSMIRIERNEKKPKTFHVIIDQSQVSTGDSYELPPIPMTTENTDEGRIEKLETEITRLTQQLERDTLGTRSSLPQATRGEEQVLTTTVTSQIGRALSEIESYTLGKMVSAFGPERTQKAIRMKTLSRSPIRDAAAMLANKAFGSKAQVKEVPEDRVHYQEL